MDPRLSGEWRKCISLDGQYVISEDGRVRRVGSSRLLVPRVGRGGYLIVHVRFAGKNTSAYLHCLIAEAFIGPRPLGQQVNHKNAIKTDNRIANLEWVTPKQNIRHAHALGMGNTPRGERQGSSKLTESDVRWLRYERANGASLDTCAASLGISKGAASMAANGRTWRHVK